MSVKVESGTAFDYDEYYRTKQLQEEAQQAKAAQTQETTTENLKVGKATPPPQNDQGVQMETTTSSASLLEALTSSEDDDDTSYETIVAKANSGQSLTSSELDTLKAKNPALYARVMQAQNARTSLRQEMESNPSNAAQTAQEMLAQYQGQDKTVTRAMEDEYRKFASRFDQVMIGANTATDTDN